MIGIRRAPALFPVFGRAPALFPGLSGGLSKVPLSVTTRMFFDRAEVINALTEMERSSLSKAGMLVKTAAKKSIKKVGAARPRLKIMRDNDGVPMQALLRHPGLRQATRQALELRIRQIQFPRGSPPGTPPYTHVPSGHMLGFRRNLLNGVDLRTKSAVIGPGRRGKDWTIPQLHEFGGRRTLVEYVYLVNRQQQQSWHRKKIKYVQALSRWATKNESPGGQWIASGRTKSATYPPRPYMLPALDACRQKLASLFGGQFYGSRVRG